MSDDDDIYGDTDPNNMPDAGAGQNASAGDGLPGFAVDGHPDWRAGAFGSGQGLLGMARVSDLVARPGDNTPATAPFGMDQPAGQGDPRLQQVSNPVLDQERNSWRWNDPTALAYDLDRKKRQLAQAQTMSGASDAATWGQLALQGGLKLGSLPAGAAIAGVGQYMNYVEAPMLQEEIRAIQSRLNQLAARSGT